ncbi:MAG: phenylalanine--tRNA ligase subunit alpha [Actinomycetota bacterium]|nr:phenylalanine--tRNA ligase subunit alpha [Actinomycetota bacterium]
MRARLDEARTEGLAIVGAVTDMASLEDARIRVLGRKASLSQVRSGLRGVPEEARKDLGRRANEVTAEINRALAAKEETFKSEEIERRWKREALDVTLPGDAPPVGTVHPLTKTIWEIVDVFVGLGYRVAEGPEIELSSYIFDALNMPASHPSRSPQDTFFIRGRGDEVLLRSETSPVQIRTMEAQDPPVYIVCPGRVYRRDTQDATHLSGFTQIEGLAVDEGVTMSDLKGSLEHFARAIFGRTLEIRLRPHFFPFTEPSAELDVQCFKCKGEGCRLCKQSGWIEVLGCGMVDPHLLEWVGYDPERYTGFAFGMGVERICALAHGVSDIRMLWENDIRFLDQFKGSP